ncbi:MAG: hypothetical protein K2P87_07970 [Lachnospiraceae bacterium]|nr:hypothetical protein [Lachnospiraceae bacterium]
MEAARIVWVGRQEYKSLVDYREASVFLGYGEQMPDSGTERELHRLADALLDVIKPRYLFVPVRLVQDCVKRPEAAGQGDPTVHIAADFGGQCLRLPGDAIHAHLGRAGLAVAACLTLGGQVDAWIDKLQKESMLDALLADALANAAVERLRIHLEQEARDVLGLDLGWLFGIGYEDFPLALQPDFLRLAGAGEGIGLSVNTKGILIPLKSVTGFINVRDGAGNGEKHCNGRCGMCPRHEECRFFRGSCSKNC